MTSTSKHKDALPTDPVIWNAQLLTLVLFIRSDRLTSYGMDVQITWDDLKAAEHAVGEFGGDNRAGVQVNIFVGKLRKSSAGSRVAAADVLL